MLIPSGVAKRIHCIRSVLTRDPIIRDVGFLQGIRSAVSWYGLSRRNVLRHLRVEPISPDLDWIDLGAYGLAWPVSGSLQRLASALVEVTAASNAHYYFTSPSTMRARDVVVDVGACEGAFALESITRYGAARVWCFEPASRMAVALRLTSQRNGLEQRLHVVPAAVGQDSRTIDFVESAHDPLLSRTLQADEPGLPACAVTSITQYSLDDWAEAEGIERMDYIKVDAEGSDLAVLVGARRSIERWRPRLAVTTYHQPGHCMQMLTYLSSLELGYEFRVKGVVCFDSIPRPVMLHAACRNGSTPGG